MRTIFIAAAPKWMRPTRSYRRRRLFESIERLTSRCIDCRVGKIGTERYCEECHQIEAVSPIHRCSKCKSIKVNEGVGSSRAHVIDAHTNLTTTTKYLRAVHERMKDAVRGMA